MQPPSGRGRPPQRGTSPEDDDQGPRDEPGTKGEGARLRAPSSPSSSSVVGDSRRQAAGPGRGGGCPLISLARLHGAADGACARGAPGWGPRARGGRAPGVPWRQQGQRGLGPGPNGESPRIPPKTAGRPRGHPADGVRRHRGESARRHRSWSAKLHRAWGAPRHRALGALRPSESGLSKTPWRRPLEAGRRARPTRKRALPRESSPPGCWVGRDDRHRSRGESTSEPPRLSERRSGTASRIGISRRRPYAGPSGSRPPRPR